MLALATETRYHPSNECAGRQTKPAQLWGRAKDMIPESHSLHSLFGELIQQHFDHDIALRDSEVQDYVVNMLTEFCEVDQVFKIREC